MASSSGTQDDDNVVSTGVIIHLTPQTGTDANHDSYRQGAFFHEERASLPRSRDSDLSSVFSTVSITSLVSRVLRRTKQSFTLTGNLRNFTIAQLCEFISKNPSLHSAHIASCSSYIQRFALVIPHRFLIFQLEREGRKDVWLRLDRRTAKEAGTPGLVRGLGETPANDTVSLSQILFTKNRRANQALGEHCCDSRGASPRLADSGKRIDFYSSLFPISSSEYASSSYCSNDPLQAW